MIPLTPDKKKALEERIVAARDWASAKDLCLYEKGTRERIVAYLELKKQSSFWRFGRKLSLEEKQEIKEQVAGLSLREAEELRGTITWKDIMRFSQDKIAKWSKDNYQATLIRTWRDTLDEQLLKWTQAEQDSRFYEEASGVTIPVEYSTSVDVMSALLKVEAEIKND